MLDMIADLKHLVEWLVGLCLAIGAWVWKKTDRKVDEMDANKASKADFQAHVIAQRAELQALTAKVEGKASGDEMDRQRDNISLLFKQDSAIEAKMHDNQIAIMTTLQGMATQVAHIAGRLDGKN